MKKGLFALIVFGGILGMAGFSIAGSSELKTYYDHYITKKADTCCKIASMLNNCCNPRMRDWKQMRTAQSKFYIQNKDELVKTMIERKLGKASHKIDYFLISEFKHRNPKQ